VQIVIIFDAEHILGLLMFMAPSLPPHELGPVSEVIAETASTPSEVTMLIVLATMPSSDAWGSRRDQNCRSDQGVLRCASTMIRVWQEALVCRTAMGRFSYWNHGDCTHRDQLTRNQGRAYRALLIEFED